MRRVLTAVVALALSSAVGLVLPTTARAGAQPEPPADKESPPAPERVKWVVHSIELSTKKSNPFRGRVVLRSKSSDSTGFLSYYWGGKCKGTKLARSRLDLLTMAMKEGYSVAIPAFPIKHGNAVVMCMQSVRVTAE